MTADLITHFNTRLQPLIEMLTIPVRVVGLVRTVEKTEGKKLKKFPMPVDEADLVPVLPDSNLGLLLYWEQSGKIQTLANRPTRTRYKATVRLIAWFDSRRLVAQSGHVKTGLVRHLQHHLLGPIADEAVEGSQAIRLSPGDVVGGRSDLFGLYTYENDLSQFVTLPYDAVGLDFTLTWWQNHACLPELYGAVGNPCA